MYGPPSFLSNLMFMGTENKGLTSLLLLGPCRELSCLSPQLTFCIGTEFFLVAVQVRTSESRELGLSCGTLFTRSLLWHFLFGHTGLQPSPVPSCLPGLSAGSWPTGSLKCGSPGVGG